MPSDSYKTFRISLRPPRIACLINSNDEDWQKKALTSIESFSRTWGGAGFIIIPTNGKTISKVFWEILFSYDPDYLWMSYQTNDRYENPLILTDELIQEIRLRLAPFHHDNSNLSHEHRNSEFLQNLLIKGSTFPNFKAKYPFTDTTTILPNCEHLSKLIEVVNLEGLMKTWVASAIGVASSIYKDELNEIGIENQILDYKENSPEIFDIVVKGVQRNLVLEGGVFPFDYAKSQLGFYRSFEFADWKEATLVIVGETVEDFCLYFCLSRMRSKVAWLPTSWLASNLEHKEPLKIYEQTPISYFARALRNLEWENHQDASTHFMSSSLKTEDLEYVRELFRNTHNFNIGDGLLFDEAKNDTENYNENLPKSIKYLLRFPSRVFEISNFDKIISKHFIDYKMAGFFEPPKPKSFSKIDKDHHWVSDFSVVDQHFPRHPLLGTEIVREPLIFHTHARVGKDSVAFVDPKTGYINNDVDSWLRKPEIRLLTAFEIFELLFNKIGYKTEISDKGRFATTTISKFGHLSAFISFFVVTKEKIFDRYLLVEKGNPNDGGLFLKTDRKWYLNFTTFENILDDKSSASVLIYSLLSMSVLHRGLIFKCQLCRNTDWYGIAEVSTEFQCRRCNLKQIYQQSHSLNQLEPNWYYKLDEVVYQALIHNSHVPILALNYLRKNSKNFDYCPELELRDPTTNEQLSELDICCIQDGKLTIGEAKIADCLASSKREENEIISKYFELSKKIGASQIIFATESGDWKEKTKERITNRFANSLTTVIFLNKTDLYAR